jgi:hypothetical protein
MPGNYAPSASREARLGSQLYILPLVKESRAGDGTIFRLLLVVVQLRGGHRVCA